MYFFFFQAEDGIRDKLVTGVQTCALPIWNRQDIKAGLKSLVKAANRNGGEDNITVVAFEIAETEVRTHDGETRENALPLRSRDEEDTLTEADAVPAVDTAVVSTAEIQAELE